MKLRHALPVCCGILLSLTLSACTTNETKGSTNSPIPATTPVSQSLTNPSSAPATAVSMPADNAIEILFKDIVTQVGLPASPVTSSTFSWLSSNGSASTVSGEVLTLANLTAGQISLINYYFQDNEFIADPNNIGNGTITGKEGYLKDNLVCLETKNGGGPYTATISCGNLP